MNFDVLNFLTPYSLCASARQSLQVGEPFRQFLMGETPKTGLPHQRAALPLREINHPAIMQRLFYLITLDREKQKITKLMF
ncbi:hypothetical protein I8751_04545 [Nostocaceae cyanobacterium CENA357]|uniref:Uncharacterized protein n=1 Tax=Atlanticothrix silvestris CENA357 TaxID=1725252 RepID=A0A8J7H8S0_9CYAN|nr:hypothetical protein [Atlanticothrix silvestris]MBH8551654.1 hypothetical protein [Atlanticothrix silvestris CENA357]